MKLAMRALLALLLLVVLALGGVWFYINTLAELAIERGASAALGVDTTVRSVRIGLLSGQIRLGGLRVANPSPFASDFLFLESGGVDVSLESLRSDTVVVPRLALDGIDVRLERRGKATNYGAIFEHLDSGDTPGSESADARKKFVIEEISIANVTGIIQFLPELGKQSELEVLIPEIRLRNVGSESTGGATLQEISGVVTQAVLTAISRKSGLPAAISGDLRSGLGGLQRIAIDLPGTATNRLADEAERRLGEGAGRAIRGLGNLLQGDSE